MSKEAMKLKTAAEKVVELCGERPLSLGKWFIDMSEACESLREALAEQPAQQALDKMAENARELGLDYEPAQQEPVAFYVYKPTLPRGHLGNVSDGDLPWVYDQDPSSGFSARMLVAPVASPPASKQRVDWIDPNDKTQKQYLPHIGEPVLFCHGGKTYCGHHNGGSFQNQDEYFNTWECRWMHLPSAHNIKENT